MTLKQQLTELRKHGWTCEHPDKIHTPMGMDKKARSCVWIEGPVVGYAETQAAYLSCDDDCVMVVGKAPRDVTFGVFLAWIQDGDVADKVAPLPNQKTLF